MTLGRAGVVVSVVAALVVSLAPVPGQATGSDYGDPDYLRHDLDNVMRSTLQGTPVQQLIDPSYLMATLDPAGRSWLNNVGDQLAGVGQGRLYTGLAQLIPGGAVGDPLAYDEIVPTPVSFVSRTGAELQGNLFWDGTPGPHPGIVITDGSLQGFQHGYWWAARTLARNGFVVLTWDPQGQGESEGFGHQPGSTTISFDGFPFQQESNFVDGTVDAVRFLLSNEAQPYLPVGWTAADAAAVQAQGETRIRWSNPVAAALDRDRIGLAGHSLGARAVSVVQQCSDEGSAWLTLALCGGRSYPIRAIVAWDGLSDAPDIEPVVPAMNQTADGYFLNPVPAFAAPWPGEQLAAFEKWRVAGLDSYSISVRGGTHLEWIQVPYIGISTTYGVRQADYYTLAWFQRFVSGVAATRDLGFEALLNGPVPDGATAGQSEFPWRGNFLSARYLSAFSFTAPDGAYFAANDLRAYAGLSPVGDWRGANADLPRAR